MSTPQATAHRNWTEGPVLRNVFELAWPSVLSMTLMTAFAITNAFFLGRLGTIPLAAAISAIFVVWMIQSVVQIVTSGATAATTNVIVESIRHATAPIITSVSTYCSGVTSRLLVSVYTE